MNYIVKFVPNDNSKKEIIHKIDMQRTYRQIVSFDAFRSGTRANATKKDKACYRDACCWAPDGLYYCLNHLEKEWLEVSQRLLDSYKKHNLPNADEADETKFPTVIHASLFDFYEYIGFDRKKRVYKK